MKRAWEGGEDRDAAKSTRKSAAANGNGHAEAEPPAAEISTPAPSKPWNPLALPEGWEDCPPFGETIHGLIASKVPLGRNFKDVVPPGKRYSPETAMRQLKHQNRDIGLVIDLTKTTRYYDRTEWTNHDVKHLKMPCAGFEAVPDEETVNRFVFEVCRFQMAEVQRVMQANAHEQKALANAPHTQPMAYPKQILVHCTHGHNRTGYCMVHYLMRWHGGTVAKWVAEFARIRPPGIYKREYIEHLFKFYHEPMPEEVEIPPTPEWKHLGDEPPEEEEEGGKKGGSFLDLNEMAEDGNGGDDEDSEMEKALEEELAKAEDMTNDDILGSAITDDHQLELQKIVHKSMATVVDKHSDQHPSNLNFRSLQRFPGSQPVSLSLKNLKLLRQRLYHVTWKADGMRYMMLICQDGCYLIDRNFRFRRLQLRFPSPSSPLGVHNCTILDGEMVIDDMTKAPGGVKPGQPGKARRYLIYDVVMLNGQSVAHYKFGQRWKTIEEEILRPRRKEMEAMARHGPNPPYSYDMEPVKVRRKDFWMLSATEKVLRSFIPKLCHESDGLILQGWNDPYVPRTHEGLLKWKYAHMNSVDFLLKRGPNDEWVLLLIDRGSLKKLEGAKVVFPGMTDEEAAAKAEGKVMECSWREEDQTWEYMRLRPDKEHPNAWGTYVKVMDSIRDNITEEVLLKEIQSLRKLPMYEAHEEKFEKEMKTRQHQQHRPQHRPHK